MTTEQCGAVGMPLPTDAKADYLADRTCTRFYCPMCGKLLRLPRDPEGTVRRHTPAPEEWPHDAPKNSLTTREPPHA